MSIGEVNTNETAHLTVAEGCGAVELRGRILEWQEAAEIAAQTTDTAPAEFEPRFMPAVACQMCRGQAIADDNGSVIAPKCTESVNGSAFVTCDMGMAEMHPELYKDENGNFPVGKVACSGCEASLAWTGRGVGVGKAGPKLLGTCAIDAAGKRFRETGWATLNKAIPARSTPENSIGEELPAFDGEVYPQDDEDLDTGYDEA
ncbi:MAG TPA: hypothetical protein VJR27_01505 [Candidatus Saccharimonadales bacterium]|nr:hypothetical protein [Candidatus Saccharimonadales bacterium]